MLRATIDANIWVSSVINARGAAARVHEAFLHEQFRLVASEPLLAELEDVLLRPRFHRKYGVTANDVYDLLFRMRENADVVEVRGLVRVCRDPDDDLVIETAIAGQSDVIVTGDDDLLGDPAALSFLASYGIEVWSVRRFVQELERVLPDGR